MFLNKSTTLTTDTISSSNNIIYTNDIKKTINKTSINLNIGLIRLLWFLLLICDNYHKIDKNLILTILFIDIAYSVFIINKKSINIVAPKNGIILQFYTEIITLFIKIYSCSFMFSTLLMNFLNTILILFTGSIFTPNILIIMLLLIVNLINKDVSNNLLLFILIIAFSATICQIIKLLLKNYLLFQFLFLITIFTIIYFINNLNININIMNYKKYIFIIALSCFIIIQIISFKKYFTKSNTLITSILFLLNIPISLYLYVELFTYIQSPYILILYCIFISSISRQRTFYTIELISLIFSNLLYYIIFEPYCHKYYVYIFFQMQPFLLIISFLFIILCFVILNFITNVNKKDIIYNLIKQQKNELININFNNINLIKINQMSPKYDIFFPQTLNYVIIKKLIRNIYEKKTSIYSIAKIIMKSKKKELNSQIFIIPLSCFIISSFLYIVFKSKQSNLLIEQ